MMAPCRRSSTGILLWMAANMVEPPEGAPPLRQAFSLTRYSSVSLTSPCLMAWKTTSAVISFIMLDGALSSSAFFSNSTLPLLASIRIAVGASPSKPPSSFLAPCTLLLAAYSRPPHPTATATKAATRPRHARAVAALDLPETDSATAISDTPRGPERPFCLSMISGQTCQVYPERKPVSAPDQVQATLSRIM